ncbi:hypothetical protein [Dyella japonica]|uniref:Uncharacterized protein n=1 Tax=Dyella japonica DSM 16301 TaxID=1440762 RepID=A0A0G9H849_9GAMM|nr:hypothetical protein [Dyella japonica]KLD65429.1 hypothetical protein Y882_02590 [Dyella japonica DSM 16301]
MTTYINAKLVASITAFAVGALYVDRQVTDLADRGVIPAGVLNGDKIQIGVVPAGHVLVPQHCTIQIPKLDTNAVATGKFKIGTDAKADALVAEKTAGAAIVLRGSDCDVTATIGDPSEDTPIYLGVTGPLATQAQTGKIIADLVIRAWQSEVDTVVGAA